MMPSWCHCGTATHPSESTSMLLSIPRTDATSRALVVPSTSLQPLKTTVSLCLQPVLCSLGYISPPPLYLLCMSQWNPTPKVLGRDGGRPRLSIEHLSMGSIRGRVHTLLKCDASAQSEPLREGEVHGRTGGGTWRAT